MTETQQEQDSGDQQQPSDPVFDGEFDADRARKLIDSLRGENKSLKSRWADAAPKLTEYDRLVEASKSELEQAQEAARQHQTRAEQAERDLARHRIALSKGLQVDDLEFIHGDDEESIAAAADKFLARTRDNASPRPPRPDPSQGSSASGGVAPSPGDQFAAFLKQQMGRQ